MFRFFIQDTNGIFPFVRYGRLRAVSSFYARDARKRGIEKTKAAAVAFQQRFSRRIDILTSISACSCPVHARRQLGMPLQAGQEAHASVSERDLPGGLRDPFRPARTAAQLHHDDERARRRAFCSRCRATAACPGSGSRDSRSWSTRRACS